MRNRDSLAARPGPVRRDAEADSPLEPLASSRAEGRFAIAARWQEVDRAHQLFLEVPQVAVILCVLALSLWLKPDGRLYGTHEQLGLPPCASRALLGIPCPSCGLTTSFALMSHGQPGLALEAHYLGPFLYVGTLGYLVLLIVFLIRGQRIKMFWPKWVPYSLMFGGLAVYLLCWAVRVWQELR